MVTTFLRYSVFKASKLYKPKKENESSLLVYIPKYKADLSLKLKKKYNKTVTTQKKVCCGIKKGFMQIYGLIMFISFFNDIICIDAGILRYRYDYHDLKFNVNATPL